MAPALTDESQMEVEAAPSSPPNNDRQIEKQDEEPTNEEEAEVNARPISFIIDRPQI